MKYIVPFCLIFFSFSSCDSPAEVKVDAGNLEIIDSQSHTVNAVLWHQTAAEYKALCYQIYNMSRVQLESKLDNHAFPYEKPPAIIMDLDETVVDNSFYNAQLALNKESYSKETWKEWSDLSHAGAVPGAVPFIAFAQSKGVKVIFISNRRIAELHSTIANVSKIGVQGVDSTDFLLRVDEGSKMNRRAQVFENYDVLMLFGDNLADFTEIFDKRSNADRNNLTDSLRTEFGSTFVVLPNVLYGEWEGSLYTYKYDWTAAEKDSIRNANITGY
jgi:5'-nucleotidase (lipoprotein e(P4) family)